MDMIGLERKLSAAFAGGEILRRELRLSPDEAEALRTRFAAQVRPIGQDWYEITFQGAY